MRGGCGSVPGGSHRTTLTVSEHNEEETEDLFAETEYEIVGRVNASAYVNHERGTTSLGNGRIQGFIYLPAEGFSDDCYTEIFLRMDRDYELYSDEYEEAVEDVMDRSEPLAEEAALQRYEGIVSDARREIADAEAELEEETQKAQAELDDARAGLEDGEAEIADGQRQLEDAQDQLDASQAEIDSGWQELAQNEEELAQGRSQAEAGQQQLAQARQQLETALAALDAAGSAGDPAQRAALEAQLGQLEQQEAGLQAQLDQIAAGRRRWKRAGNSCGMPRPGWKTGGRRSRTTCRSWKRPVRNWPKADRNTRTDDRSWKRKLPKPGRRSKMRRAIWIRSKSRKSMCWAGTAIWDTPCSKTTRTSWRA